MNLLYELLLDRHPFSGETQAELFERIQNHEPRPPRQLVPGIPDELERICLKCLEKRRTDRYTSSAGLIDDLRHWLKGIDQPKPREPVTAPAPPAAARELASATPQPDSASGRLRIVPKGLRSFDAGDADFFLDLLPGPRDRDGLPDHIRFWKTRIEETDPDETFSVGLIYGPSGCGKSSLVKAGLLPRLAADVRPIYVEATPDDTEVRLLKLLGKRVPDIRPSESLPEIIRQLRERGQRGDKILIILDQFEQWLHAHGDQQSSQLVDALRQCDGGCVQCIVMVRDDFWLAVSRFMHQLEVRLVEGHNLVLTDLFDLDHARRVLIAFGRAYGRLPATGALSTESEEFLHDSVIGLAEDGKVVCVRLSLCAEMMKGIPWTPSS